MNTQSVPIEIPEQPPALARLALFIDRLRPAPSDHQTDPGRRLRAETTRLADQEAECELLRVDILSLFVAAPQSPVIAEAGVQTGQGFGLELRHRIGHRLLPRVPRPDRLDDVAEILFDGRHDHLWVAAIDDHDWLKLFERLGLNQLESGASWRLRQTLLEAARTLSYRIASVGLDSELLRNEPNLDRLESPFIAQNAEFLPIYAQALAKQELPDAELARHLPVLLEQCEDVIDRIRRRARESGTSVRLTYLLARLDQLIDRLRLIIDTLFDDQCALNAVRLFKTLVAGFKTRDRAFRFIGENINLLARNITENASRHGEHYIATEWPAWLAMVRAAALGGVIIAVMAALKIQLGHLHLPPLTEGLLFGLNYGIGFALIHMVGGVVATKQPAMTATTLAAELEDARPSELKRVADMVRSVAHTQFAAIAGNILLALPVAGLIALTWPTLFDRPLAEPTKAASLLAELHPIESGALWFAAVAGVGLFLSGLVAGYYDNKVRYLDQAARVANHPWLRGWLSPDRRARLADYIDHHHGAIMGNLLFGLYLGLAGSIVDLTGLPIDIRHVAFASANVGSALALADFRIPHAALALALAGVAGIGLVNLLVSFSLALYVAMRSRQQTLALLPGLLIKVVQLFLTRPWTFFYPSTESRTQAPATKAKSGQ
jgi:site-specific recombinase